MDRDGTCDISQCCILAGFFLLFGKGETTVFDNISVRMFVRSGSRQILQAEAC